MKIRYEPVAVMRILTRRPYRIMPQYREKRHWRFSEKADLRRAESKYPGDKILLSPHFSLRRSDCGRRSGKSK